ncbi:AMP-binding protein [Desulfospira joergensenii]|uniref:AMP-binding protein n=1 Tax=Desulfospira joergensenii TaxID=53329 RepID=UPI0003B52D99|nr:AMP-binding protein [Desulfospira joergensenii]
MSRLHDLTFFDIYEKNGRIFKDRCAIHWEGQDISHKALLTKTRQLASGLGSLNLEPGTRIAVLAKNHPLFFHLFGAASALNLCLVMINRRLSKDEIRHIIQDTTPELIICDSGMAGLAADLGSESSWIKHQFIIDGPDENLSGLYTDLPDFSSGNAFPKDPFVIIHTAAVQGKPRGAVLSQENILLSNLQVIRYFNITADTNHLNILPLFHIMGINLGLATLQAGGNNVILEKFDSQKTIDLIQEQKVNLFGSFPPILANLLDVIDKGAGDLSSLEKVAGLDSPETITQWESKTDSRFWTMYGQTETSGLITFAPYFRRPGSAGEISPLADIQIADDFDNLLPVNETGEILVKGPLVFQGYWNAAELNAFTFREGWHHTGDLGMIDSDGFLFFKGRKAEKELIKPGGENVFPAEVEKAVLRHEAVKEVCVFGVPDPRFGEGIKAVVSLHPGKDVAKEDLIQFTGTLIAGYKKPRYLEFTEELPKSDDGTIDRAAVKKAFS